MHFAVEATFGLRFASDGGNFLTIVLGHQRRSGRRFVQLPEMTLGLAGVASERIEMADLSVCVDVRMTRQILEVTLRHFDRESFKYHETTRTELFSP